MLEKPSFPVLSVADLTGRLAEFRALIEGESKKGPVDVEAIRQAVREKDLGLVFMTRALRGLDDFEEGQRSKKKLRSGRGTDVLALEQVERVLADLDDAAKKILDLDQAPRNGSLDRAEQKDAKELEGFSGILVRALLEGSTNHFTWEMQDWQKAVKTALRSQKQREDLHASIDRTAEHHAETNAGAGAIRWHLHALATSKIQRAATPHCAGARRSASGQENSFDLGSEKEKLAKGETSRLRRVPKFLRPKHADPHGKGHLSDVEVRKLLATDDLVAFAEAKKEEARRNAGGDWTGYLAGNDIDGLFHAKDPELRAF